MAAVLQFQKLDPQGRETLLKVVNEDAEKLLAEMGDSHPNMRTLKAELAECNKVFHSLSMAASESGKDGSNFCGRHLIYFNTGTQNVLSMQCSLVSYILAQFNLMKVWNFLPYISL